MRSLRNLFSLLFLGFTLHGLAQETPVYSDPVSYYNNGLELYDKEKFAAAITEFETYLEKGTEYEFRINARFYLAFCHNELNHKDAEQQILNLLEEHPDHPKSNYARFVLGRSYYNRGNIGKSLQYMEETDYLNLTPDDRKAYHFIYGYGLFTKDKFQEARTQLKAIEKNKDKFYYPTQYYLGYMDLMEDKNESSLTYFHRLYKSKVYGELAMKMSCLAYYKMERYEDLIAFSDTINAGAQMEDIYWERGKAYYQLDQPQEALNNFQKGRGTRDLSYEDQYMMGMAFYGLKDYENAYVHFTSIHSDTSSLKQNALMYAADCFLKLDKKTNARNAFYEASRLETDKKIQEQAHFNYAKLSLEPPFQNEAVGILHKFVETWPNSQYADEAKGLLGEALLGAKRYSDAIPVLESITNKNAKIKSTYQQICYFYANELLRQDPTKALEYFEKARTYPVDPKIDAMVDFWEGELFYKNGEQAKARKLWERFCNNSKAGETPVYADGLYNLAYSYFDNKEYSKALPRFKKYTEVEAFAGDKKAKYIDGMTRLGDCYYITSNNDGDIYKKAIDAYGYVTTKEAANSDYAWFQIGMIHGLQGKSEEKIVTMKRVTSLYPNSEYVDDALFQIALVDMSRQHYQSALRGFSFLLEEYPNGVYAKSSYLYRGMAKYNLNQPDNALSDFMTVAQNFSKDQQTDEAIGFIKTIMTELGRGVELIDTLKILNEQISVSFEDSTIYYAALKSYEDKNCEKAISAFGSYLQRFDKPYFKTQAEFFRSECLYTANRYEEALPGYEYTVQKKFPEYYERSLRRTAAIYIWKTQGASAVPHLKELEKIASQKDNILFAQSNLMYIYLGMNQLEDARSYAEKIIANEKALKTEKRDANLIMGRVFIKEEKYDEAKTFFNKVEKEKEASNAKRAEAKYYLCYIAYKKGALKDVPKLVYELDEKYANQVYWVAKGYNLMAEAYLDQKDLFNARPILNSLVENYPVQDDGIIEESKRLLQRAQDIENMGTGNE